MFIFVLMMMVVMLMFILLIFIMVMLMGAINGISLFIGEFFSVCIMVMMMLCRFGSQYLFQDLCLQVALSFNGIHDHFAVELRNRSCDDSRIRIMLADHGNGFLDLFLAGFVCSCQHYRAGIFDLVDEELTEVFEIELCFCGIHYGHSAVERHFRVLFCDIVDRAHNVIELADAGGLDQDPFGCELAHNFLEGCIKISDQGAADAAAVHLADLDAGFFQETAVDADLAEFIFDQDDPGSRQRVLEQFFDQCCFSCPQKSGDNIYFRHLIFLSADTPARYMPRSRGRITSFNLLPLYHKI